MKQRNRATLLTLAGLVALGLTWSASATPIVRGQAETWNGGGLGTAGDWTDLTGGIVTLSNPGDYLNAAFEAQPGPPVPESEVLRAISTSTGGRFTGDYVASGINNVAFSFLADDFVPSDLSLQFHSSASGRTWTFALTPPTQVDIWTTYTVSIADADPVGRGWSSGLFGNTEFFADITTVDWIGVSITRNADLGVQNFGLDSFVFIVPEPGSLSMLAVMLMCLVPTTRRHLRLQLEEEETA